MFRIVHDGNFDPAILAKNDNLRDVRLIAIPNQELANETLALLIDSYGPIFQIEEYEPKRYSIDASPGNLNMRNP